MPNFPIHTLNSGVRNTKAVNRNESMMLIPIVCVVNTLYQQQIAKMFSPLAPEKDRRGIAKSMEEAAGLIDAGSYSSKIARHRK